jgi:F-type H+-transporting ATPase subunit b
MPQFDFSFFSSLAFWSVVSFSILLVILYKFGLPTIVEVLEVRERQIKNDLDRAEQARTEAEAKLAEYAEQLRQARSEAAAIIEEARRLAQRQVDDSHQRAEQQTATMIKDAREEIAREQAQLRESLRAETAALVMAATEKVLARRLTSEDDHRLIQESLDVVESQWGGGRP